MLKSKRSDSCLFCSLRIKKLAYVLHLAAPRTLLLTYIYVCLLTLLFSYTTACVDADSDADADADESFCSELTMN